MGNESSKNKRYKGDKFVLKLMNKDIREKKRDQLNKKNQKKKPKKNWINY